MTLSGPTPSPGDAPPAEPVRPRDTLLGGPLGAHARIPATRVASGRWAGTLVPAWQPFAAVLSVLATAMVALGVVQKSYCFENGWGGDAVFWRACYSDLPNMLVSSGLVDSSFPYSVNALTQPVGTGAVLWLLSFFAPLGAAGAQPFVGVWAVVAAVLAAALVIVTVLTTRRHPRAATAIAVSPLLITVSIVGVDLLGVLCISAGLLLWSREREWAAGAVFGLAVLSRTYALIVLLALALSAIRAGQYRALARTAGVALGSALFVLVLLRAMGYDVGAAYSSWLSASPEFGSLVYLFTLAGRPLPFAGATVVALCGWVLAIIAGSLMALGVRRRPMIAETSIVMLVVIMLTAKAVPPQWGLWLLPLVALARVPWRIYLPWVATEVVYFVMVWMHIPYQANPSRALPAGWYAFFLILRLAMLVVLAVRVYRTAAARPAAPRVADEASALRAEADDAAGPAAGQRDRLVVTF